MSSLTHFSLEPGCEDYSLLDQAVVDSEQGLDSILIESIETLELDALFVEPSGVPSSFSSGFLCWVSAISDFIIYGTRLEHYFCLCLSWARCQHPN